MYQKIKLYGGENYYASLLNDSQGWIVWDKENGENNFADCELAWTSFNLAIRIFHFRWAGMLQGDMKNKEFRIHPTQKPVALYKWLLNRYAKSDDIILDTHVGSASSLIACYETGHKYVGFEIDPVYFESAQSRLRNAEAQMTLWDSGLIGE